MINGIKRGAFAYETEMFRLHFFSARNGFRLFHALPPIFFLEHRAES